MNISINEMAEKIMNYPEISIVYHVRPDGDCIGSSFALALALKSVDIKCNVVGTDKVPRKHRYLTDNLKFDELVNPIYIAVDSASTNRVGTFADKHFTFCIDHHMGNTIDADYKYIEPTAGACAEIILKLIKVMNIKVTKEIADFLYTGLVSDTMSFRTYDTTVQSFETAAELKRYGADIFNIGRINTFYKSKARLELESILKQSFHFIENNKIATGIIRLKDLEAVNVEDSDIEGVNSLIQEMEEVQIAVTIRELKNGGCRCSVRTHGDVYAKNICEFHGGKGHLHAAACELDCSPDEARIIIEKTCREFLNNSKN